jgi:predicted DNA-binding protein (MmcQ/YjbR family)
VVHAPDTNGKETEVDIDIIRDYCLSNFKGVKEDMPFGEDVLVFRVQGKIFLLTRLMARPLAINLKCDPVKAMELRERYESIQPGYHMNKKHWNTVLLDGTVPSKEVFRMIDHSYELVRNGKVGTGKPTRKRKQI